jgi:transposase-like protein
MTEETPARYSSREWPAVVRRVLDNKETLRKIADDYGVSYETVRRIVRAAKE